MRKRYVSNNSDQPTTSHDGELPLDRDCAVYYRQSTLPQTKNISYRQQTEDLPAWALSLGWRPEQVILIDEDEGLSGTLGIEQRPGLTRLYDLITSGAIGCVICADPDRLSRDHWQILPNVFMRACEESRVIIKTLHMTYDFSGPYAEFSRLAFRQSSQMAADFLKTYIREKMLPARQWLIDRGLFGGGCPPLGYLVGCAPDNDRKFLPFEPLAELIRQCVELVIYHDGVLKAAARHIRQNGPFFPPSAELQQQVPEGTRLILSSSYCGDRGGAPSFRMLKDFSENCVRIGHWMDRGRVIRWNNHEPILDERLFFKAFNLISPVTLTGEPNPDFSPSPARGHFYIPKQEKPRNEPEPLLRGLGLFKTRDELGDLRMVSVMWDDGFYYRSEGKNGGGWHKRAKLVDSWIEQVIQLRLSASQAQGIVETIAQNHTERAKIEKRLKQQLSGLTKEKSRLAAKFVATDIFQFVQEARNKYLACEQREAEIKRKLADLSQENEQDRRVSELKSHIDDLAGHWDRLTREEKIVAIRLVVSEVWAVPQNGDLRIVLIWRDQGIYPNPETGEIPVGPEYGMFTLPNGEITICLDDTDNTTMPLGSGDSGWTTREFECLRSLVSQEASQVEICEGLPHKTWRQIRTKWALEAPRLGLNPHLQVKPKPIHEHETIRMFRERTAITDIPDHQLSSPIRR